MNYGAVLKEIRTYDLITQEQIVKVLEIILVFLLIIFLALLLIKIIENRKIT